MSFIRQWFESKSAPKKEEKKEDEKLKILNDILQHIPASEFKPLEQLLRYFPAPEQFKVEQLSFIDGPDGYRVRLVAPGEDAEFKRQHPELPPGAISPILSALKKNCEGMENYISHKTLGRESVVVVDKAVSLATLNQALAKLLPSPTPPGGPALR